MIHNTDYDDFSDQINSQIEQARQDRENGQTRIFDTAKEAIDFLHASVPENASD